MRTFLLTGVLLLAGCAWEPGEGFAVVTPTVKAAYAPKADRDVGGGYQKLSSEYQVRIDAASLRLGRIELLSLSSGGGGSFDPSRPPPGYSLCHGGHCHRDDGALIPYEQIAAELGGGGGISTVMSLPVEAPWNLLEPEARTVPCEPCELPRTEVSRGRWPLSALRLEGLVRDGSLPARFEGERRFLLELAPPEGSTAPVMVLEGDVELPSDRHHPPLVDLELRLLLTASLFDAVDWSAVEADANGVVDFSASANAPARAALLEQLARIVPESEVHRAER
ncbi:MAG TPA: hypothetical protein VLQ93_05485 [Myxococcaceae bacterium]|nr:hypothetical protein [Myxococcaceae bacterium]